MSSPDVPLNNSYDVTERSAHGLLENSAWGAPEPEGSVNAPSKGSEGEIYEGDISFHAPKTGFMNPMCSEALPFVSLAFRLRSHSWHTNVERLHAFVASQVACTLEDIQQYDYEPEQLTAFSYSLCLLLDEAVMSTPWGKRSHWSHNPLLSEFHQDTQGGEKIFKLLARLKQEPKRFQDSLEFIYICLCMGLRGKYALEAKGDEHLQRLTEELNVIISELRGPPPDLFPDTLHNVMSGKPRSRRIWPWWSPLLISAGLIAGLYGYYSYQLHLITIEVLHAFNALSFQ
ncbi:type IVB secretion system protein IcmH/DotU [Pseudomonas sp. PSKL.D1]|uniref:type IVB secretion system protein IcmH/DotU n=1 Tax=Pseudomonas sp. PSKL.D1 TaxID=3029060 RepID=UPI0023814BE1|nr:type IVB secretion system protein IcmH/DotU [Pseudomonas sp. PSKL.D1]WDY56307.1 type IVB secretion system protein IcmH/DotU [Pseudomonas sp. PSKL.D1]